MLDVGDTSNKTGSETKDIIDVVIGVTQVVSRKMLVQLNYSFSNSSGYLTDPYKILSLVDGTSGDTIPRAVFTARQSTTWVARFSTPPTGT
jgi:hypothetical protein